VPTPFVHALQVPVFHCHGFSLFVQLHGHATAGNIRGAFGSDSAFVVYEDGQEPSPVRVAGTHGIHVGRVQPFKAEGAFGLWLVADNLRVAASNAIRTAENIMLAVIGRPS